jgi:hypothetical protein
MPWGRTPGADSALIVTIWLAQGAALTSPAIQEYYCNIINIIYFILNLSHSIGSGRFLS